MHTRISWILRFHMTQTTQQIEVAESLRLFRSTNLIVEQLRKNQQQQRNYQSDSHIGHHVLAFLLAIHRIGSTCFIHHLTIWGVTCFLDFSLSTFLEEERIIVVINTVITLNGNHLQFLFWQ